MPRRFASLNIETPLNPAQCATITFLEHACKRDNASCHVEQGFAGEYYVERTECLAWDHETTTWVMRGDGKLEIL